jgi:nicotinamidase-related amidase
MPPNVPVDAAVRNDPARRLADGVALPVGTHQNGRWIVASSTALLVIDVQQGMIDGFESDWQEALPAIDRLVAKARTQGSTVVFIQHCGQSDSHPLHRSRPGWALYSGLETRAGDLRVEKTWSDAFRDTDLDAALRERAVSTLVVAGAQTEFCVDATARRSLSLGYDVQLVADGHTTSANGLLDREQIIAHHNQTLANLATVGRRLTVVPSADVDFR